MPIQPNKIHKRILLVCLILILLVIAIWLIKRYIYPSATTASTNGILSERATQFVEKQKMQDDSVWKEQNISGDNKIINDQASGLTVATDCFTVEFPFMTANTKIENEEKKCVVRTRVSSPASQLVISTQQLVGQIDDYDAVMLRRSDTEKFKEKNIHLAGFQSSLRFDEQDTVTLFLVKDDILIIAAFNGLAQPSLLSDELLENIATHITLL